MAPIDLSTLEAFATACRRGLEGLAVKRGSIFQGFPYGACGPAAELVGRLAHEQFGVSGRYVCANNHRTFTSDQSHAWFEVGAHLLDITHDQFEGTGLRSWVFLISNPWHRQFRSREERAGFAVPAGWPMYPYDGYEAMRAALDVGDSANGDV
jgi:hypothetical protein